MPSPNDVHLDYQGQGDDGTKATKKRRRCLLLPLFCIIFLFASIGVGIAIAAKNGLFQSGESGNNKGANSESGADSIEPLPISCPEVPASKRFVLFWQTEQEGCEKIPDGVTHVAWGFSLVGNGDNTASLHFQGHSETLKRCISDLHKRCIRSLGSVGGATNTGNMATINNPKKFAASVLTLIQEYNLDGVDIDDETVGEEYNKNRVESYMKELHFQLKSPPNNYIISFDGLAFEANDTKCTAPEMAPYIRCLPNIASYVDWVHVLAYNVDIDDKVAAKIYDNAISELFLPFEKKLGDVSKVNIGICAWEGCAYGPGPSRTVIDKWVAYAKKKGGVMIYAGSQDYSRDFLYTKQMVNDMK